MPSSKASNKLARVIAISSGKGGVGKTTIAANLSILIARTGYKTCLFDADINSANLNIILNTYPQYTLQHLVNEEKKLSDMIIHCQSGFDMIAGASGIVEFLQLTKQQRRLFIDTINQLQSNYWVLQIKWM